MNCDRCDADLGVDGPGDETPSDGDLFWCPDCGASYVWIDALVPEAAGDEQDRDTVPDGAP